MMPPISTLTVAPVPLSRRRLAVIGIVGLCVLGLSLLVAGPGLLVPFVASLTLLALAPTSAQARPLVVAVAYGVGVVIVLGLGAMLPPAGWAVGLEAVAILVALGALRLNHAPAVALPLALMVNQADPLPVTLVVLLGGALLTGAALVIRKKGL